MPVVPLCGVINLGAVKGSVGVGEGAGGAGTEAPRCAVVNVQTSDQAAGVSGSAGFILDATIQ